MKGIRGNGLLARVIDRRGKRRAKILVFSPVGDLGQLEGFCRHVKKLGLASRADFLFIYRKGLKIPRVPLMAIHATERLPLGTSGAFFAGECLAYLLGYEYLVLSDLDAKLDSGKTLNSMLRLAKESGCAVAPLSKSPSEGAPKGGYFVINQWGVLPRRVMSEIGFSAPYMHKGGEDYELSRRLLHAGKLRIYRGGFSTHPKTGLHVFGKMADRKKYYPYLSGLMKAYAFIAGYDRFAWARYALWHAYYSYFADVFCDNSLHRVLGNPFDLRILSEIRGDGSRFFSMTAIPSAPSCDRAMPRMTAALLPTASLLFFGKAKFPGEEARLSVSRPEFAARLLFSILLIPARFGSALSSAARAKAIAKKFPFPPTPKNARESARLYINYLSKGKSWVGP